MLCVRAVCLFNDRPTDRSALVRIEHSVSSSDINNKTCKQYETNAKQKETEERKNRHTRLTIFGIEAITAKRRKKEKKNKRDG